MQSLACAKPWVPSLVLQGKSSIRAILGLRLRQDFILEATLDYTGLCLLPLTLQNVLNVGLFLSPTASLNSSQ